ncbi:hypothetical protein GCM10020369_67060 [Cryptosporangium minutisporangium]|uniref:Uncharacterized protein n=1 Tax=Cryptosporangium minutisporangium TaxID=113569 RepID=A0ABP6T9K9_9ACTN
MSAAADSPLSFPVKYPAPKQPAPTTTSATITPMISGNRLRFGAGAGGGNPDGAPNVPGGVPAAPGAPPKLGGGGRDEVG